MGNPQSEPVQHRTALPTAGKLFIVPTPIGNLQDITLRALDILKSSELILAEDTRNSVKLLNHFGINTPLTPFHQHNEHQVLAHLIRQLEGGKTMAMISDAGTPGISDPAFLLVRECIKTGIPVECLPGATAFVPALVNSGLPTTRFCFEGFLPVKKADRPCSKNWPWKNVPLFCTESPHRLLKALEELAQFLGPERRACVSRELSKLHEENARGTLAELLLHFSSKEVKGEIVLVVEGKEE